MRKFAVLLVAVGVTAILAGEANAQRQPGGGGGRGMGGLGGNSALMLISNKSVQEELKLTDDQKKTIDEKRTEFMSTLGEKMRDLQDKSAEDRMAELKKLSEPIVKLIDETLKPEQTKRFKQIQRQVGGAAAIIEEDNAKELKLTDDEKTKIKALVDDMRKDERDLRPQGGRQQGGGNQADRAEQAKKIEALHKETNDKALEILTPDQQKVWKELSGEKFDYKPDAFGGNRKKKSKDDI